mmetsp:Transcript_23162/g.58028  ORF Transcript_23162/g.58028 Transcript_23162/m.58028 type:complete len:219 (-) Transcript_23162:804-1460(-)
MHKQDTHCAALLTGASIRVLIALIRHHVVKVPLGHVGPQNLPVEAPALNLDLAVQRLGEALGDARATGELRHSGARRDEEGLHDAPRCVDEVEVRPGQPAVVQQPDKLLHHGRHPVAGLEGGPVAHVESSHQLQDGDLEGEVERRDDGNRTVRPPVPLRCLPGVVPRRTEGLREEADLIPRKVVEKGPRHRHLRHRLRVALGAHPLDQAGEEVSDVGV